MILRKPEGSQKKGRFDLYDDATVGYVTLNPQGIILGVNLAFADLIGSSRESFTNETIAHLIIKEDQDIYHLFQTKLFETGKSRCELCLKTLECESFWVCLITREMQKEFIRKAENASIRHPNQKNVDFFNISFEDTGTGISESDLPNVFDPYFTTKEKGVQKGVGLGLADAQAIFIRHGGNIHMDSAIGKGTTVIVSLPVEEFCP